MPKEERAQNVSTQKEQAALYLKRGHSDYTWANFESALHLYGKAFTLSSSVDWIEGMVRSLIHMSRSSDRLNDSEQAGVYLDQAFYLLDDSVPPELVLLVQNRKTEWLLFNDSPESALQWNDMVLKDMKTIKSEEAGEVWRVRGAILKALKEYDLALEAMNKALKLDQKGNYISELASDYYILASILSLSNREDEAILSMNSALEKDKFIENTPGIAQDLYGLGLIYEKLGDHEKAYHYFQRSYLVQRSSDQESIPERLLSRLQNPPDESPWSIDSD
jgi:tetratricopeptide (TPR) repeat protein